MLLRLVIVDTLAVLFVSFIQVRAVGVELRVVKALLALMYITASFARCTDTLQGQ
jgi:hypothetical protein